MMTYEEFVKALLLEHPEYPEIADCEDFLRDSYVDYVTDALYDSRDLLD